MRTDSQYADPRWSCYRKKAYATQQIAQKVARRVNERDALADLVDYFCRCGRWHVGGRLAGT